MLKSIKLKNFRGFDSHEISLNKKSTIVVGRNNAGKSTFVEALRLIALISNRYQNAVYNPVPQWVSNIPKNYRGISPSIKNIGINFDTIFHRYSDPPCIITAQFDNDSIVTIYLGGEDKIYGIIKNSDGDIIKNRDQAKNIVFDAIDILPQVAPLKKDELILTSDYVRSNMSSSLAHLHFRNQLKLFPELFPIFKESVESIWQNVIIKELIYRSSFPNEPLHLLVRNGDFETEVSEMGHGLQIWLQIMWFLTRTSRTSTIILDEPDVYIHPDLQRKLIRFLKNRYPQIIITTHSVEIMSEVEPNEILVIDRQKSRSTYANTFPVVQSLIDNIGSTQNIHVARLWNSRRLILVEGKDVKLLKHLQNTLHPESQEGFDVIPNMSLGGWGGWNYAMGSSMLLKNSFGENIVAYCIFDSDYHLSEQIEKRRTQAKEKGIQLHIWSQKEIENYLINPSTLQRIINKGVAKRTVPPTLEEITDKIKRLSLDMEDTVLDAISTEFETYNKGWKAAKSNKEARNKIAEAKENKGNILSLVSGKELISKLSQWSQQEFGVSFSATSIVREMQAHEIPDEIKKVVSAIELCQEFS